MADGEFFDEDTDYSTDIEGESLDDRADISDGGLDDDSGGTGSRTRRDDDDDDDDDDRTTSTTTDTDGDEEFVDQPGAQADPIAKYDPSSPEYEGPGVDEGGTDTGGQEESPPGDGDEVDADAGTDPDAGDDTTERLKDDADSDPLREQTEPDGDGEFVDQPGAQDETIPKYDPSSPQYQGPEVTTERAPGPVGSGRDDEPSDIDEATVEEFSRQSVRRSLEERYPDAENITISQTGPGTYEVTVEREDYYDRQGTVTVDQNQVRGQLMAQEARLEEASGRDVDIEIREDGAVVPGGEQPESSADQPGAQAETIPRFDPSSPDYQGPGSDDILTVEFGGERFPGATDEPQGVGIRSESDVEQQVEQQLEEQVGRQRARRLGFGEEIVAPPGAEGTTESGTRLTPETARAFADLERGRDYTIDVERTGTGLAISAALTETFLEAETRQATATAVERQTGVPIDPETDVRVTDEGGRGTLTETASERVAGAQAQERYGDVRIEDAGDVPLVGGLIQEFADRVGGRPVAVSDLPRRVELETATTETRAGGPGPRRAVEREQVTGVAVETFAPGTSVEEALATAKVEYSEFASDVAEANLEYNPFAQAAVSEAERFGYGSEAETAIRSAVRQGLELGNLPRLAGTVKEAGEFTAFATEETAAGRLGISYEPAQTRRTSAGLEIAAPLTVEETGLAPRVAADVGTGVEQAVDYARENPAEVAGGVVGSLVLSAGVMGAASAVSSRAGLATRALIQPGEEALGYGGFYATRATAGTRTAERLFPNREPLIFSEEAAIRAGRQAGARAGRLGGRLRGELGQYEVNVRARPGLFGGGGVIEVERGEVEEEELGPELDPFDVSDTRLYDPTRQFGEPEGVGATTDPTEPGVPQDIGPSIGPRGEAGGFRGGTVEENFETFLEEEQERAQAAQEVRLEQEQRRRYESAVLEEPLAMEATRPLAMEGFRIQPRTAIDIRSEELAETGLASELARPRELVSEYRGETETESFLELELELEEEFETELETEFELELELEGEIEADFDRERPERGPRKRRRRPPGWVRRIEGQLRNPLTGE